MLYETKYEKFIPSKLVVKHYFLKFMGKKLDLKNPKTFNEKLNWLKLYYHNKDLTKLVDKYENRSEIEKIIGKEYLIPLIGVYKSFDEIDFSKLPKKFVIKCNHDSGSYIVCKDKNKLNIEETKMHINSHLNSNYFYKWREWPYKNVKPRIIIEEYMEDKKSKSFDDYKFMCFNGKVDSVMVCTNRNNGDPHFYFFYKEWNLKKYNPNSLKKYNERLPKKPENMDKMFSIAEKLSKGYPFVRVDLYSANSKIYFGEMTFFPQAGWDANLNEEVDLMWGNMINLVRKK